MKQWNIRDLTLGGLFTALIGVGAFLKITIPVQPVPMHFTLQFFFVLLAALLLGSKRAFASVLTYLVIGLCGIPVFAFTASWIWASAFALRFSSISLMGLKRKRLIRYT